MPLDTASLTGHSIVSDLGASLGGAALDGLAGLVRTQKNRLFKVETPLGADVLILDALSGMEGVSQPFSFRLSLLSEQANVELKKLMGGLVKVTLETASKEDRHFSGYVSQFSHTGSDGGLLFYEATIGPWLEFLRHRFNHRVFQQMNVLAILRKVFSEYGAHAKFEIGAKEASYKPITLCVQYGESDLDFVSRLMEEHGIHYYFRFDKQDHVLVIEDDSTISKKMPMKEVLAFNAEAGASNNDTIDLWSAHRQMVSNRYAAKTFDFKKPGDPMNVSVDTNQAMGTLPTMERYEHTGAFTYLDDQAGDRFSKLRIEELELQSKLFHGGGNVRNLTCGHFFQLTDHYDAGPTQLDREFFVISVFHSGSNNYLAKGSDAVYRNQFSCVRKTIPFRPGRTTAKPVMRGPQTATVVGSNGEDIHCDKYGRVLIQFHWDREGKFDDQSLCFVRVATQWAGGRFGFVSLPRVGTEVLVDFLEGDPDRPIITGAVYNEANMPPWDLPANKTQSGVLTRSSKGGGYENANALRFEDKQGEEEVWLHAEKTLRVEVEASESHSVGGKRTKTIDQDEKSDVKKNRTETVGGDDSLMVTGNRTEQAKTITLTASDSITLVCGGSTVELTPSHILLKSPQIDMNP